MSRVRQKRVDSAEGLSKGTRGRGILLGGMLLAILLVLALIVIVPQLGDDELPTAELYEGIAMEGRFLGDPDAPVLIRDFSDFKCPHCLDSATNLVPEVIESYVAEGLVRIEFVPVAVLGQESTFAAQAAMCAEEQGAFWPYQDLLFANQSDRFSIERLTDFADEVGLDTQQFRGCLSSGKYLPQLEANMADFQRSGGEGTPTFVVGDTLVPGAVPFEEMQPVIEAELEEADV